MSSPKWRDTKSTLIAHHYNPYLAKGCRLLFSHCCFDLLSLLSTETIVHCFKNNRKNTLLSCWRSSVTLSRSNKQYLLSWMTSYQRLPRFLNDVLITAVKTAILNDVIAMVSKAVILHAQCSPSNDWKLIKILYLFS